ncbi:MAPK regulated corepressor interacting protein 2 [Episyrphus balteatus]|uniref:MAPK regulated corepressor interacting protein 2 n=1 Tax=Episyrphus balteatus TaxID=286459 RepID=UPI00248605D0|nr:MAPK regulated corepressor interacting protein 2 [Episyrphus balteatus]
MDRNNGYTYIRRQGQTINSPSNNDGRTSSSIPTREPLTQHDELIRYIKEAWHKVNEQGPHGAPVIYRNESDQLKNFKPFDLEEYWGQRLVQNIHVSHGHQ